ncbi:MAG: hypothetical protein MJZ86_07325 [Bacteroidales bacterium]|nr:hypothetical protein [Bacteroidales bacterium]
METIRYSFIKKLLGESTYDEYKGYAKKIIPIATIVLVMFIVLSRFVHWGIVNWLLGLTLGTSLVFVAYVLGVILFLDFCVDVEMKEDSHGWSSFPKVMPAKYKFTIIWTFTLIILGIVAIFLSNKYKKNYDFECETFYVDEVMGIYHLEPCHHHAENDCTKMKGYEVIQYDYTFCESCKEWLENAASESVANRYSRR